MTPLALNLTDLAALFSTNRWKVQEWIRQGLPFIPTGKRHKLVLVSEAEKWLKSRQVVLGKSR